MLIVWGIIKRIAKLLINILIKLVVWIGLWIPIVFTGLFFITMSLKGAHWVDWQGYFQIGIVVSFILAVLWFLRNFRPKRRRKK